MGPMGKAEGKAKTLDKTGTKGTHRTLKIQYFLSLTHSLSVSLCLSQGYIHLFIHSQNQQNTQAQLSHVMSSKQEQQEREAKLRETYLQIIYQPFKDFFGDKWQEEPYWAAVEVFKAKAKEMGYDEPGPVLSRCRLPDSYEDMRDILKEGPEECYRDGWKSKIVGEPLDVGLLLNECEHLSGKKYTGEKIVILDFWATW